MFLEALLEQGFQAVKLHLGRPMAEQDLAVVRAVRRRLPDRVALMTDYNQALTVTEAIRPVHPSPSSARPRIWAAPILAEPLPIADSMAQVPDPPGSGVAWDQDAVKRYRIA